MKYLKWISEVSRAHRWPLLGIVFCHLILTAVSLSFVWVCKSLVDAAVNILGGKGSTHSLLMLSLALAAIILLRIGFNMLRSFLQTRTEVRLKNSMRKKLFDSLLHLRYDTSSKYHSGDIVNRLQEDARVVSSAIATSVPNVIGTSFQLAAATLFLARLDWRLTLIVLFIVCIFVFFGKFIILRIRRLTKDIRNSDSEVQAHLQESVQHLTLLQSLEHLDESSRELSLLQNSLYDKEMKRIRFSLVSRSCISLAFQTGHLAAFLWGVWGISTGAVTYGLMTAFLQLVSQIQHPVIELSSIVPSLIHASASVDRLMELEDLPKESASGRKMLSGIAGIRLENVSYRYPDGAEDVMSSFNFDFSPGSRTAIMGPTGVGKTTLIRLLLALIEPRSGKLEIYDEEGENIPVSAQTRCNLVYVPQGNSLFSGTIRENLLMGNPEATDEQLHRALYTAAADFVEKMPDGIDSQCFESGGGLSEGQAQRIAVARALLRPGSILLLDEFSSALDKDTETLLLSRIASAAERKTIIFVTHREAILKVCYRVLEL